MATSAEQLAQAKALVDAALNPTIEATQRARLEAQAEAQRQAQSIQGFSQAAATEAAKAAPEIQGAYDQAANRSVEWAKGYSIGMQLAQQQAANESNTLLQKLGAPEGQMIQAGPGAADVLYGTSGVIPATALEREGAAFTSAAAMLPSTTLGRGQQLQASYLRDAAKEDKKFRDAILDVEAKKPGAIQQALAELKEFALKERGQKLDEAIAIEKLGISKANLKLSEARVGISAANADTARYRAQLAKLTSDRNWQATLRRLGLQEAGLGIRVDELEAKKRSGGFTPKQIRDLQVEALETARADFNGFYIDSKGNNVVTAKLKPLETLRDLIASGIPFSVAIKAIQSLGRTAISREKGDPQNAAFYRMWAATLKWTRPKKKK